MDTSSLKQAKVKPMRWLPVIGACILLFPLQEVFASEISQTTSTVAEQASHSWLDDQDKDGLADAWEVLIFKTNPQEADSDGDGFNDTVEVQQAHDPNSKKMSITFNDADKDGLDDRFEWLFKADPLKKDTDQDGYDDGPEVFSGFSPISTARDPLPKSILITLSKQTLQQKLGTVTIATYRVSTGMPGMATPTGDFQVMGKSPRAWSRSAKLWMPYWMQFTSRGHGIHELPEWPGGKKEGANHLGRPVSHGCVRLGVGAAKSMYDWAPIGTPIKIVR